MGDTRPQAKCPWCRQPRKFALTKRGKLWTHSRYSREFSGEYDTRCAGAGRKPEDWKPGMSAVPGQ